MALFRCSSGNGGGGSDGVNFVEAPVYQALNTGKTYSDLEIGKTYTYIVTISGSRDLAVSSVQGGTFTEKEKVQTSGLSYCLCWIVPSSTSITVNALSASSGGVTKMLLG